MNICAYVHTVSIFAIMSTLRNAHKRLVVTKEKKM